PDHEPMPVRSRITNCRSCRKPIVWAETRANSRRPHGGRMPVDLDPTAEHGGRVPHGNVKLIWRELYDEPLAVVLGPSGLNLERPHPAAALAGGLTDDPELLLYTSH